MSHMLAHYLQAIVLVNIFQICFAFAKMYNILEKHQAFIAYIFKSVQFEKGYASSATPTWIFYIGAMLLCFKWCHGKTRVYTRWRLWISREITFQWLLFYSFRLWMFGTHFLKIFLVKVRAYILKVPEDFEDTPYFVGVLGLTICTFLSFTPYITICIISYTADIGQNFFVWLGEDPWLRTEIGIAGHYLHRPPHVLDQPKHHCAYSIRRSCSLNDLVYRRPNYKRQLEFEINRRCTWRIWRSENDLGIKAYEGLLD